MQKFDLLKSLNEQETDNATTIELPKGVAYQQFELESKCVGVVFIPLREAENFEKAMSQVDIEDEYIIRKTIRQFRGITR